MQNIYHNSILVKEEDINKVKYLQIVLLLLFSGNYLANIFSIYEMSGFNGKKFYGNCFLCPGFLIECFNLSEIWQMTISEMNIALFTLSILIFIGVDFSIEVNIYKKFSKNFKKKIFINEINEGMNLV